MNEIDNIMLKDIKWLLHYLKENHWLFSYLKKLYKIDVNNNPNNYKKWVNYIMKNKNTYISFLKLSSFYEKNTSQENDWKFLLKTNTALLSSPKIFTVWREEPFTLSNSNNVFDDLDEHDKWKNVTKNYAILKKLLYQINAYE